MIAGGLLVSIFLLSWALTWGVRHYALSKNLMDIPNERSSHSVATARGGGVAIVVGFLLALPVLGWLGLMDRPALFALSGSGLSVALIGFADDHGHIAARWRLLGHFTAAIWALFWLDGLAPIAVFNGTLDLGWVGHALAVVYLVWMLNLYNFMDGIDGLASAEAICACLGISLVYALTGNASFMWGGVALAAAVGGFLYWNFPPARIFMGDAGSGFLGVVLGGMSLQAAWVAPELLWSWVILLAVFIVDATWTLVRRLINGQKVYQAHRSHAYQYASRRYGSHKKVTYTVVGINILWLIPMAVAVGLGVIPGVVGGIVAYLPLIVLAYAYRAGLPEPASS